MKPSKLINATHFVVFLIAGCVLTGCKQDHYNPEKTEQQSVFNFSTKSSYTLNIKYDVPEGYRVYFEVYPEMPLEEVNGEYVRKAGITAIDKGYTDEKGNYSNPIMLRSALNKVYIYSPNIGVPELLVAEVSGEQLQQAARLSHGSSSALSKVNTRAGTTNSTVKFDNITTRILSAWIHNGDGETTKIPNAGIFNDKAKVWGRPVNLDFVNQASFPGQGSPAKVIPAEIYKTINQTLPGDGNGTVDPNVLKNGDIHVAKEAEINLHFISEAGAYMNTLAYYCYETANPPKSASDIKFQTIAFPNAKYLRSHDFPLNGTHYDYGALLPGEGIKLHYFDKDGNDKGLTFPAGVSIGWILYADGYTLASFPGGELTKGEGPIYSDKTLMNGLTHVAVFRHGDFVITSFEDGRKTNESDARDYDDVVFHVASTPSDAITPGVPDKDPDQPGDDKVVAEVSTQGILSFEDLWPSQGDFDMNDVVIRYVSTVGYNIKNQVLKTTDKYTVLWSGATLNNSFACQNPNISAGNAQVSIQDGNGGSSVDAAQNIIRIANNVLAYANKNEKTSFTVISEFANPIAKAAFVLPPYNPFITVDGNNGKEVHLTNATPTVYADKGLFGQGQDRSVPEKGKYYITYNSDNIQMPFAIDLTFDKPEDINGYIISPEGSRIDAVYPKFISWIQSGGQQNKDWYLSPKK